jgi:hypothetical protein
MELSKGYGKLMARRLGSGKSRNGDGEKRGIGKANKRKARGREKQEWGSGVKVKPVAVSPL